MKIIRVDNFDRTNVDDVLVCENINEYYGMFIVEFLNKKFSGDFDPDYFELVEDDRMLYIYHN